MIPAIIACKVNRDANGHERTSSFRIAISAMPLKRTWIMSRSMSASGQEQAIRSVRIPAHETVEIPMSPTRQAPLQVRITFDCLIVFIFPLYAASGFGCAGVGGCSSSLEAASSQTWPSCLRDSRTSSSCVSRAHLKHSSAIARYSAAVFMERCTPFLRKSLRRFSQVCLP